MRVPRSTWLPLIWLIASTALLAIPSNAHGQTLPSCNVWSSVIGWTGNYSLKARGSGMIGPATVTVSYSSSGNLNLTLAGPSCPSTNLLWEAALDASAKASASYQLTAPCSDGGTAQESFDTTKIGTSSVTLKTDLSKGSLSFIPVVASAPLLETVVDCKGGTSKVPLPAVSYTPPVDKMPVFQLASDPSGGFQIKNRSFPAADPISSLTLNWQLSLDLTPVSDIPVGELTSPSPIGWVRTAFTWQQTLISGKNSSFTGLTVSEVTAGPGKDTCWYPGSPYAPVTTLSGGTWTVQADNTWGPDAVGWGDLQVRDYRNAGRAPCGFTVYQQMQIRWWDGSLHNYGLVNTLKGGIGPTWVTSERAGHTASERQ